MKNYTDEEILNKIKTLSSFTHYPKTYYIVGIRSKEDKPDTYDDKFYIYKGTTFITVMTGTTNSGLYGLKNFNLWNKKGTAIVKVDECYYNVWTRGLHKRKVPALVQTGKLKIIRDNNRNNKSGDSNLYSIESGIGINFHPNTYNLNIVNKIINIIIGKWSVGCSVINDIIKYRSFLNYTKPQKIFTYILLNEF